MIGFLRTLFFIVVLYYLIRFVSRVLVPYFRAVTEMNERQKRDEKPYISHTAGNPPSKKSRPAADGEYVDYTEVK